MLTRNHLGLPQLVQKHRRDGRRSRMRGQGPIHPGAFLLPWGFPQPSLPAEGVQRQ